MSDNAYDYAVFIGRFQPLHLGHEAIIRKAYEISETPIIIVGSSTASRSLRNPFSYEERRDMIEGAIEVMYPGIGDAPPETTPYIVRPISDSAYNFHDWLIRVKSLIKEETRDSIKVALLGHYKDDTEYLNFFPEYDFIPVDSMEGGIGATRIREDMFEGKFGTSNRFCSKSVYDTLLKWADSPEYGELREEWCFIKNYKEEWKNAPYPPTFVTTDAVVICLGYVLLIKRGRHPGKGLYALPGGFLGQTESIQRGCIRELKEETKLDTSKRILEKSIVNTNVFDNPYRDPRGRTITHAFLFDLDATSLPKIEAADDASEALWVPLNNLEEVEDKMFGDHSQIIRYFIHRLS